MDRLLARLERRLGAIAIEHLTSFVVGGMAIVFILQTLRPDFAMKLVLDPVLVREGEIWRLVTFIFLPPSTSMIWILIALYWLWIIGTNLENEWGAFKYNAYYFLGMVGTGLAALILGRPIDNYYLNLSLLFAIATVAPDYEFLLFFVVPMKMKWLGWFSAALLGYAAVFGSWSTRAAIVAAMLNYFLFFGGTLVGLLRGRNVRVRQAARRASSRPPAFRPAQAASGRACAICGAREDDGADIRVCACETCRATGGPRTLCLPHARQH